MSQPIELLEPSALVSNIDRGAITKDAALASIAISLKRLADALDDIVRNGAALNVDARLNG
jgi:hypothetical protein